MKIKTIDIQAKEWFDKINGNSYFAAIITLNFGMKAQRVLKLPFQYGYGDHYKQMAFEALQEQGILKDVEKYENGSTEMPWGYCKRKNIILRANKQTGCKKADVKAFGI